MALDVLKTLAPIAGMGIGAAFGGPAGAALGGSIGGAVGAGIGLLEDQEGIGGSTPAQQALMGIQMRNLEKMQAMQGLNAQQVQNLNQSTAFTQQQQVQQMNSLNQVSASPIDRQNMIRGLLNLVGQQGQAAKQTIMEGDIRAEAARIASVGTQSAMAAQQAEAIRKADLAKEEYAKRLKDLNRTNFGKLLGNVAASATALAGTLPEDQAVAQKQDAGTIGAATIAPPKDTMPNITNATKGIVTNIKNSAAPGQNLDPVYSGDIDAVSMFLGSV